MALPNSNAILSKSILDWVKAVIGILPKIIELPNPPTQDQMARFFNFKKNQFDQFENHIGDILNISSSSSFSNTAEYQHRYVRRLALKQAGQRASLVPVTSEPIAGPSESF